MQLIGPARAVPTQWLTTCSTINCRLEGGMQAGSLDAQRRVKRQRRARAWACGEVTDGAEHLRLWLGRNGHPWLRFLSGKRTVTLAVRRHSPNRSTVNVRCRTKVARCAGGAPSP